MPTLFYLRCMKCDTPVNDKDNPKMTGAVRDEINKNRKRNSWSGWLCKCGHYNGLDK